MKLKADLVPKHYTVNATLGENDMLALIVELRTYIAEFDAGEQVVSLHDALAKSYAGDLPQTSGKPDDGLALA